MTKTRSVERVALIWGLCLLLVSAVTASETAKPETPWPGTKNSFHSFAQYDFEIDGMDCKVVVPGESADGKPWIWRARFFGHEPQTDIALLKRGFHVAYVDVSGLYGAPKAVARWDRFYNYLVESHGFAKKAVLEGMSRGGLILFNWAAKNPEKVLCIYADAPVCDFKSWPGVNSAIADAYGLTEKEAHEYRRNPIDNLKPLADAGVPLLHVVGVADEVVPVAENTAVVERRYKELGGTIEVIRKKGVGHHPHSLEDPRPIVDFILKYSRPSLEEGALHSDGGPWKFYPAGDGNVKLSNVLLIGDSIMNGYRGSVIEGLRGTANVDCWLTPVHLKSEGLLEDLAKVASFREYDVIHFNIGLHGWPQGRISKEEYPLLLRSYVATLKKHAPLARLIWGSITQVHEKGKKELNKEINPTIVRRNAMAAQVMKDEGVAVNDLYRLMSDRLDLVSGDRFHWQKGAYTIMAKQVVAAISEAERRPNVVLIMVDDLGFSDLRCYGGEIETPNLDRLAAEGLMFTQFYNTAKCSPSRAALLTGCYHREVGETKLANCMTLAEAMRRAGYATFMTGKWHLSSNPIKRGFDRYFGHLSGATNFFKGDETFRLDDKPFIVPEEGFYTTDANTDYAMRFLEEAESKPFFLYIAYNAPHYPLQAWPEDIEKYRGKFMKGWDRLRTERHERQLKAGLVKAEWKLAPRDGAVRPWDSLSAQEKEVEDLTMAVYAAMIDRLDQNIGKLCAKLEEMGVADNTILLFLSDNGGCPFQRTKDRSIPPGSADSYWTYHKGWAQLSNTPFRLYKQNQHEGGISTPLIAHWPGKIRPGTKTDQAGHIVDIMATLLDITGTEYPEVFNDARLRPLRGKSLLPVFEGRQRAPHEEIFFEFNKYKALRSGKWKIAWQKERWELYDVEADRTELNDLAAEMPEKTKELAARYDLWLKELGRSKKGRKK